MTRYRPRAVLLLFLLLNLTACSSAIESWRGLPSPPSVAEHIVAEQPERVRVTMQDGSQLDIEDPFVSGDQLMGKRWRTLGVNRLIGNTDDISVPLADIVQLEVRDVEMARSAGVSALLVLGILGALLYGAVTGAGM
ncbi:uncharacterized protein METZ01_LOCUS402644 [marine metagenome]|uniref:Uncharacterized protein n=1 Tax=marine metagenome TaxID=408172 RepID=A0A382VTT7_9ZZZZ